MTLVKIKSRRLAFAALPLLAVLGSPIAAQAADVTLTLPLRGTVDAIIDWGTEDANSRCVRKVTTPGNVSCTYSEAIDGLGPFEVRVGGTVTQFGAGNTAYPNVDKIKKVNSWGSLGLTSLSGAFNGASGLTQVPTDFPESVTNISYLFKGAQTFNQDLSSWGMKMRNVTAMDGAFDGAANFDQSLDRWCVRHIKAPDTTFRNGFRNGATKLSAAKEPKWGNCGATLAGGNLPAAETGSLVSLNLKNDLSLWPNAPAGSNVEAVTFAVVSGTLPPGLVLNSLTGEITGTPLTAGTYNFTVRAQQIIP